MNRRRVSLLSLFLVLLPDASVKAALPTSIRLVAETGACPASERVANELRRLLPTVPIGADPSGLEIRIGDLGGRYRVCLGGVDKELVDARRRCDERARAAGVFIYLTLVPPSVELPTR